MKFRFESGLQIVNDLIFYCHKLGAAEYHVDYLPSPDNIQLCVEAKIENLSPDKLKEFTHAMLQHRQREIEDSYWAISYDLDNPCEPTLLGMMLDDVRIDYDGEILTIRALR